jgi:hypothetical protein
VWFLFEREAELHIGSMPLSTWRQRFDTM